MRRTAISTGRRAPNHPRPRSRSLQNDLSQEPRARPPGPGTPHTNSVLVRPSRRSFFFTLQSTPFHALQIVSAGISVRKLSHGHQTGQSSPVPRNFSNQIWFRTPLIGDEFPCAHTIQPISIPHNPPRRLQGLWYITPIDVYICLSPQQGPGKGRSPGRCCVPRKWQRFYSLGGVLGAVFVVLLLSIILCCRTQ